MIGPDTLARWREDARKTTTTQGMHVIVLVGEIERLARELQAEREVTQGSFRMRDGLLKQCELADQVIQTTHAQMREAQAVTVQAVGVVEQLQAVTMQLHEAQAQAEQFQDVLAQLQAAQAQVQDTQTKLIAAQDLAFQAFDALTVAKTMQERVGDLSRSYTAWLLDTTNAEAQVGFERDLRAVVGLAPAAVSAAVEVAHAAAAEVAHA